MGFAAGEPAVFSAGSRGRLAVLVQGLPATGRVAYPAEVLPVGGGPGRWGGAGRRGYIHSRVGNPMFRAPEKSLAILEGGYGGLACGSGMAAQFRGRDHTGREVAGPRTNRETFLSAGQGEGVLEPAALS